MAINCYTERVRPYKIWIYWLPAVIWAAIIFSFSAHTAITVSTTKTIDFVVKKTAHFSEYFILSALIYRALYGTTKTRGLNLLLLTLTLTVLYAVTDEFHQSFVPGREPRIWDVIIDGVGSVAALTILTRCLRRQVLYNDKRKHT